jgi:imidazolonepropionase-like amidohydrolase
MMETLAIRGVRHVVTLSTDENLVARNGRIDRGPIERGSRVLGRGLWVLPGLVDAHAHLVISPRMGTTAWTKAASTDPDILRRRVLRHLRDQRNGGVLLVRDAGAVSGVASDAVTNPPLGLPYLQAAGRFIAPPGRYPPGAAIEVRGRALLEAAVTEAARGGGWIKMIADYPALDDPGGRPEVEWTPDELRQAIEAARELGVRVAVHAMSRAAADLAVRVGADSVEHGWCMTSDHLAHLAASGRAWVPTVRAFETGLAKQRAMRQRMDGFWDEAAENLRTRVQEAELSGVTILCGTDGWVAHGGVAREGLALIAFGLSIPRAIQAVSVDGWRYLRREEPLALGAVADFLTFDHDPLDDPSVLLTPIHIVRGGRLVHERPH